MTKSIKLIFGAVAVGLVYLVFTTSGPLTVPANNTASTYQAVSQVSQSVVQTSVQQSLSNDNYYVNSIGNTVHSPVKTSDGSIPAGASARCRDGSYSFSQHRSGTCSHHGGVAVWL